MCCPNQNFRELLEQEYLRAWCLSYHPTNSIKAQGVEIINTAELATKLSVAYQMLQSGADAALKRCQSQAWLLTSHPVPVVIHPRQSFLLEPQAVILTDWLSHCLQTPSNNNVLLNCGKSLLTSTLAYLPGITLGEIELPKEKIYEACSRRIFLLTRCISGCPNTSVKARISHWILSTHF